MKRPLLFSLDSQNNILITIEKNKPFINLLFNQEMQVTELSLYRTITAQLLEGGREEIIQALHIANSGGFYSPFFIMH